MVAPDTASPAREECCTGGAAADTAGKRRYQMTVQPNERSSTKVEMAQLAKEAERGQQWSTGTPIPPMVAVATAEVPPPNPVPPPSAPSE